MLGFRRPYRSAGRDWCCTASSTDSAPTALGSLESVHAHLILQLAVEGEQHFGLGHRAKPASDCGPCAACDGVAALPEGVRNRRARSLTTARTGGGGVRRKGALELPAYSRTPPLHGTSTRQRTRTGGRWILVPLVTGEPVCMTCAGRRELVIK